MQPHVNTFEKGLNSDLAKLTPQVGMYINGVNLRIRTDIGFSSYAVTNIEGHVAAFSLPQTSSVHTIVYSGRLTGSPINTTVTIDGVTVSITLTDTNTPEEFYAQLASLLTLNFPLFNAYSQGTSVVIYSPSLGFNHTVGFNNIGFSVTTTVTSQNTFHIIGYTTIKDRIYLLTANVTTQNPGGVNPDLAADPASAGQIWEVDVNLLTGIGTPRLLYNNILNLTAFHTVPSPGAIIGRYESNLIQRMYWTDNFNRPRRFNVADPNGFGAFVQDLSLQPNTLFSTPILQEVIQSGTVLTGVHCYAYRLKKNNGQETVFSLESNLTHVVTANELTSTFMLYRGSTPNVASGKSLRYLINNIDTSYDRIEVVDIYFEDSVSNIPVINIIYDEPIPQSGVYEFTHTGSETTVPVSVEEYTTFNLTIDRVKSIISKNNYLFFGNIREKRLDFDFDAKSFRYNYLGQTYATPSDIDAINPNQSPVPHEAGFIFQNPATTGGVLKFGGTGANIDYEFLPDIDAITANTSDAENARMLLDTNGTGYTQTPYRSISRTTNTYDLTVSLRPHENTFQNFKSPYITSALRGYVRDEVYRFGIVFYDLAGNPGFVNWIADIRMPHVFMPLSDIPVGDVRAISDSDRELKFPFTKKESTTEFRAYNLGVKFTVRVPASIQPLVSGFSIVRTEREEDDKTILGQGIFNNAWYRPGTNDIYLVDPGYNNNVDNTLSTAFPEFNAENYYKQGDGNIGSFMTPEFVFGKHSFAYQNGDSLDIVAVLGNSATGLAYSAVSTPVHKGFVNKTYEFVTNYPKAFDEGGTAFFSGSLALADTASAEPYNVDNTACYTPTIAGSPYNVWNCTPPMNTNGDPGGWSSRLFRMGAGPKTLVLRFGSYPNGAGCLANLDVWRLPTNDHIASEAGAPTQRVYLANYKRLVPNQYGGQTFAQRSRNVYISTGHYQPIVQNTTSYVGKVYGGDCFVTVLDYVQRRKNYIDGFAAFPVGVGLPERTLVGRIVPVESTINVELRTSPNGKVLNYDMFPDDTGLTSTGIDIDDDLLHEPVYSRESTFRTFVPKPDPFTEVFEYETRIRASEPKINGELVDSWTSFPALQFIDVEGVYGPINNLVILQGNLLYFQDRAFGKASVNERSLINDTDGASLQLGVSGLLSRYDYASTEVGCKHQWGMGVGGESIYFFDALKRRIYRFSGGIEPLNELKGQVGFFDSQFEGSGLITDNPILGNGMAFTFDYRFLEALFTWHTTTTTGETKRFTIAYNSLPDVNAFTSLYSYYPRIYINTQNFLFSAQSTNNVYLHNTGPFGVFYNQTAAPTQLSFVVNPEPSRTKKYNVFTWVTETKDLTASAGLNLDTWSRIRVYNNHQNSDWIDLVPKPIPGFNVARNRKREWTMHVPRNAVNTAAVDIDIFDPANIDQTQLFKPRMSDNHLVVDLEYDNTNNYKLVCPFVITDTLLVN